MSSLVDPSECSVLPSMALRNRAQPFFRQRLLSTIAASEIWVRIPIAAEVDDPFETGFSPVSFIRALC